jgi:hypothetical protein
MCGGTTQKIGFLHRAAWQKSVSTAIERANHDAGAKSTRR